MGERVVSKWKGQNFEEVDVPLGSGPSSQQLVVEYIVQFLNFILEIKFAS